MSGEVGALQSQYDPASRTISLILHLGDEELTAGWRLALTSTVRLTPPDGAGVLLVDRLATYHELAPVPALQLDAASSWRVDGLSLSHRPLHANDGPVSAFVIRSDGATVPVRVEPMQRSGDDKAGVSHPPVDPSLRRDGDVALVPYPVTLTFDEQPISGRRTASLADGPGDAFAAWSAVVGLAARCGSRGTLVDDGNLTVHASHAPGLGAEAYRLVIDDARIDVLASSAAGFRYAFVTLAQWLPFGLPARAEIDDGPHYSWRGLHIDLARQWFEPGVVERLIDVAAWRKLSRLHLHLTDDEGWRLPVAGHPELAAIGGTRGYGLPLPPMLGGGAAATGRAYAPDEIAHWVARADALGIVLVPEVDLPAHGHAALTALPWLRDPDDASGAASVQGFVDNVLVPGHPATMPFVAAVLGAVAELFPSSPWIHVGGDEVPDFAWRRSPIVGRLKAERGLISSSDVEAAFHREVADMIRERFGRSVGAWQEAAESAGLRPDDGYVVGWRSAEACRRLAAAGHDVVVAPGQAYYLDMAGDDEWTTPGASWAGATSFADVCGFEPDAGWSPGERTHLLGVQGCLWTEHAGDEAALLDRLFPRLDAIAERAWTGRIVGGPAALAWRSARMSGTAGRR